MPKFVLLWTDAAMWLLAFAMLAYTLMVLRRPGLAANWKKVFRDAAALSSTVVLLLCLALTLLEKGKIEVLAGANLPSLIKLIDIRTKLPLEQAVKDAIDAGRKYMRAGSADL
jgi:hypothetical protein